MLTLPDFEMMSSRQIPHISNGKIVGWLLSLRVSRAGQQVTIRRDYTCTDIERKQLESGRNADRVLEEILTRELTNGMLEEALAQLNKELENEVRSG